MSRASPEPGLIMGTSWEPGRTFAIVTTCHAEAFEAYGRRMIDSLDRHFPADVPLLFYPESFEPGPLPRRVDVRELLHASPELAAFKARHARNRRAHGRRREWRLSFQLRPPGFKLRERGLGFKWNAVRFAHKVFALLHAAAHTSADVLVWIDADTVFFDDVDPVMLERLVPRDCFLGCLRRSMMWTETGVVAYNLRHPATQGFLARFRAMYVEDLLFREKQYHDAWLFDRVRERVEVQTGARSFDIAQGAGQLARHVLVNCWLGSFMDHLKGNRKFTGRPETGDLVVPRTEAYWVRHLEGIRAAEDAAPVAMIDTGSVAA